MNDPVVVYRIATDTPLYEADDVSGRGAWHTGGRWNRAGVPMLYTSISRALACLETVVHFGDEPLPLNRYLVEIAVPANCWSARTMFDVSAHVGWEALPAGRRSIDWGTFWSLGGQALLAEVPSAIVPEEANVLINPTHPDAVHVRARKVRRWTYDGRLTPDAQPPQRRRR